MKVDLDFPWFMYDNISQTTIGSLSSTSTIEETCSMMELPFYPVDDEDPLFSFNLNQLVNGDYPSTNLPIDGFINFYSLKLCSSNAKQMCMYLQLTMGFSEIAYKGLETQSKLTGSHVLKNGSVILEIVNSLRTKNSIVNDIECYDIEKFLKNHGDGVMNIAFQVVDCDAVYQKAIKNGAKTINFPRIISDNKGAVKIATISVPKIDVQHTLIENIDYKGAYLPGYSEPKNSSEWFRKHLDSLPKVSFTVLDHCVENLSFNQMSSQVSLYCKIFGFHKYWSVDESDVSTGSTSLKSSVIASSNGKIKIPINEPVKTEFQSQIEEFNLFNNGPGIQHFALGTNDIVNTVTSLMKRGITFNTVSIEYYQELKLRLINDDIELFEDFAILQKLNILIDYDLSTRNSKSKKCNYILQIFTNTLHDRPTLFIEIIQRHHHNGFGKGTFKGLFQSIEQQQKLRGTLMKRRYLNVINA